MSKIKSNMVFWNETDQHIRFKSNATFANDYKYEYVGTATRAEFDLLLEVLFIVFEDDFISLEDFERVFGDIRTFCDVVKKIVEEN
jgi:hypothetical protein